MMDLSVNISLEEALDRGWEILASCFDPEETGMRTELVDEFWPKNGKSKEKKKKAVEHGKAKTDKK